MRCTTVYRNVMAPCANTTRYSKLMLFIYWKDLSLHLFLHWQHITPDSYIPCLTDLCKALWEVMLSYHSTMQWHEELDNKEGPATQGNVAFHLVACQWYHIPFSPFTSRETVILVIETSVIDNDI